MILYEHTQPGYAIRWGLGLGALVVLVTTLPLMLIQRAFVIVPVLVIAILVAIGLLFHAMTVQVSDAYLTLWFGPGVLKRRWVLEEIVQVKAVRNPWWYGWGIHWVPGRGWIYNVAGWEAIEIERTRGSRVRIGTDEPQALLAAVKKARDL